MGSEPGSDPIRSKAAPTTLLLTPEQGQSRALTPLIGLRLLIRRQRIGVEIKERPEDDRGRDQGDDHYVDHVLDHFLGVLRFLRQSVAVVPVDAGDFCCA